MKNYTNILFFVGLFVLGFLVYAPSINGDFVFDDISVIKSNTALDVPLSEVPQSLKNNEVPRRDRLLFWMSFALEKSLWGDHSSGYRIINLIFHIFSSILIFFLTKILLEFKKLDYGKIFPYAVSGLFLVFPVCIESVAYISGRNSGIGGFFFIFGCLLWLLMFKKHSQLQKKAIYAILSFISFGCAVLFKETYVIFPVIVIMFTLYSYSFSRKVVFSVLLLVILIGISSFMFAEKINIPPFTTLNQVKTIYFNNPAQIMRSLATNTNGILYSLRLCAFPDKLNIDHDLPLIQGISDWRFIIGFLCLSVLFMILFLLRQKIPLTFWSYIFYLTVILPSNSIILRGNIQWMVDPLSERNLYLPSLFFLLSFIELLNILFKNKNYLKVVVILLLVIYSGRSFNRNIDFKNTFNLWKSSVKYSPERARPNFNYAIELKKKDELKDAITYAEKAFQLLPRENTLGLLGSLYKQAGYDKKFEALMMSALKQKEFRRGYVYHSLGEYYYKKNDIEHAKKYLTESVERDSENPLPVLSLAFIALDEQNIPEAEKFIKDVQSIFDKFEGSYEKEGIVDNTLLARLCFAESLMSFLKKNESQGIKLCEKAIDLQPLFTEPYLKLGEYYYVKQQDRVSWDYFYKASKTPDFEQYKNQVMPMLDELQKSLSKQD